MSSGNGQAETAEKTEISTLDVELHVAPRNGKASREVVARWGDREFTDVLDPSRASAREKFVERLAEEWGIDALEQLKHIKTLICEKAQEADALAAQLAQEAVNRGVTESL
jgi:hypothetical protein